MDKDDRRAVKALAAQRLAEASYSPRKMILIHTGAILVLSLILALIDYLLEQQISSTGGLSGIGSRSILVTAQSVLQLAQTVLLPFWQIGYIYITMKIARGKSFSIWDLTEGFHRFGPVLRLNILKTLLVIIIGIASANIASTIFAVTPFSVPLLNYLLPLLEDPAIANDPAALQEALSAASSELYIPLMVIFVIVLLVIGTPVFFHYRMANYYLLDSDQPKALGAMRDSRKLMRHLCLDVFKLDVSFWWFYLLEALIAVIGYGDLIMSWLGFPLPIHADVAFFLFFILYLAGQLALHLWRKNDIELTYACTYELLRSRHDPRPQPQNQGWEC